MQGVSDGPAERPISEAYSRDPREPGAPDPYAWPEDPATPPPSSQGPITLIVSYGAPFVLLLLFPAIAWIFLLPAALMLRWTAHPTHRRRLVWVYALTGLFSFAPWIGMLFE